MKQRTIKTPPNGPDSFTRAQAEQAVEVVKLRAELAEMNDKLDKADEQTWMLMEHIEAKDKRIAELENKCTLLNQACADMEETTKEYESMERRIAELKQFAALRDDVIKTRGAYIDELEAENGERANKVHALEQRIADAPHEPSCDEVRRVAGRCDCWKKA